MAVALISGCLLYGVALQSVLVLLLFGIGQFFRWERRGFVAATTGAFVATYAFLGLVSAQNLQRLRNEFPVVSLEDRLPPVTAGTAGDAPLPAAASERLDGLEYWFDNKSENWRAQRRQYNLQILHEDTVAAFIRQPGFGQARMSGMYDYFLQGRDRSEKPIPQPGPPVFPAWSAGSFADTNEADKSKPKQELKFPGDHSRAETEFLHPLDFGYFRDRSHVTGFVGHQFTEASDLQIAPEWEMRTILLLGAVLHQPPVVYLSDKLPRMDELRKGPTCPLDDFEAAGLEKFRAGQDLFVHEEGGVMRALGSLRAAKQCIACHGGKRGDLLGGFSYTLVSKPSSRPLGTR